MEANNEEVAFINNDSEDVVTDYDNNDMNKHLFQEHDNNINNINNDIMFGQLNNSNINNNNNCIYNIFSKVINAIHGPISIYLLPESFNKKYSI